MKRASALLVVTGLLASASGAAEASEAARLRRALEEAGEGRLRAGQGVAGLGRFEAEVEAQRAAFRAAAARPLPPKATARLAEARANYEAGQGRLLEMLKLLNAPAPGPGPASPADARARAASLEDARALAARIEEAERREPLSSELRVRAPRLRPPALPVAAPGAAPQARAALTGATEERPIGPVSPLLRQVAAGLGGALEIYTFVRNSIASELYYGALKGPVETYLERGGNDADTAALLIELLRAKGIPARYVVGTAEVPSATLLRLAGTAGTIEDAVRALDRAGIPGEPVLSAGGISAVRMARVWVEAYLPYVNYRGLDIDAQGKAWVPLDAAFKLHEAAGGLDAVSELGFDPRAAFDEYLLEPRTETPREFVRARVEALLAAQRPGTTYAQVLASAGAAGETLGLLPNTLPYAATGAEVSYALPPALTHRVGFHAEAGSSSLLDHELDAADVLGDRVTIDFEPFDDEDRAVVALYGGMRETPPYLFEVRPVLRLGGVVVAGGGAVGFGVKYTLRLDLRTPSGTETVTNTLLAGNLTAIGFGGRQGTTSETSQDEAAQILAGIAFGYLERWNEGDAELAALLRVVPIRPTLSACFAMSDIDVQYAGGDALFPLTFDWKGVAIDADFRPMAPVGIETRAREAQFALLSGLEGTVLEERVLAQSLEVESVSTASALQLAHAQGVEVVDVTGANVDTVVPALPFDDSVKEEIRGAVEAGRLARVPVAPVTKLAWTGVGYILLNEETGEAAYQLQGGHSGGVTAAAVDGFPPRLRPLLHDPGTETADCQDPKKKLPASLEPVSEAVSLGVVNTKLDEPIRVRVKDAEGNFLPGACVAFTVLVGGGQLVLPSTQAEGDQVVVLSDGSGVAAVDFRPGKSTRIVPRFFCEDGRNCTGDDPDQYTQVGLNQVTVSAGGARLAEPFTVYALPDGQCGHPGGACQAKLALNTPRFQTGAFNMSVGGPMQVAVLDQYDNPLSNYAVRFAAEPTPTIGTPPDGWSLFREEATQTPGKVLKPADHRKCIEADASPGLGDCAGEAADVTVRSSPVGAIAYAVVGDSPYSRYDYDIGTAAEQKRLVVSYGTVGWLCGSPRRTDCSNVDEPTTIVINGTRPRRVNRHNDFIEAYKVGTTGDVTVWATSIEEGNTIYKDGDPDEDGPNFRTRGNNTYKRKRLEDSRFVGKPLTVGTGVIPAVAAHVGNGNYRADMRLSTTPQDNIVDFDTIQTPPVIRYLNEFPGNHRGSYYRVAPLYLDFANNAARRAPNPNLPWRGGFQFTLWGAKVEIAKVSPTSILLADGPLTTAGEPASPTTTHSVQVKHLIQPEGWRRILDPWLVFFSLQDAQGAVVAATQAGDDFSAPTSDRFSIPRGVSLARGDYTANLEVQSVGKDSIGAPGGGIKADPKAIRASRVNFVMDANNDTLVDEKDEETLRKQPGATFHFWEGDPDRALKAESPQDGNGLHLLEEYATLRVVLDDALPGGEQLSLRLAGAGLAMRVVPHVGASSGCGTKSYLCNLQLAQQQDGRRLIQEQHSLDDVVKLQLPLPAGKNDYIYRCSPNKTAGETCSGVLKLVRDVDGTLETLIERNVSFPPIESLLSVYSARLPTESTTVASSASAVPGWAALPPASEAPKIFVFVHGYNVPLSNALDRWFPMVFKRLYWVGLPLIKEQKEKAEERFHMVGFTWPGNQGSILGTDTSPYPPNEFNAMQAAVPLAMFLTDDGNDGVYRRDVQVMAHSLGNMVVNEALSMAPGGTVKRYIMNEAALAAEAFAPSLYNPSTLELDELDSTVHKWGFPDDAQDTSVGNWVRQAQAMHDERFVPSTACTGPSTGPPPPGPSDLIRWERAKEDAKNANRDLPEPLYDRRWRPFTNTFSAWTGVYANVPARTQLFNTYNPRDPAITIGDTSGFRAWRFVQRNLKPFVPPLGLGHDDRCTLFWAPLVDQDAAQQDAVWLNGRTWPGLGAVKPATEIGRLTRRWGERAYWFATRSGAAGSMVITQSSSSIEQRSFEAVGGDRHNYLFRERALPPLWDTYGYLKDVLLR